MLVNSEGIVLKQRKIANNRRMITVFTRNYGKISAGTSINEKGKNRAALALRPFTYAEYDIFKGRDSYSINSAQVRKSYYSIGEDLDRFLTASKFIEYLDKILEEGIPRPKLFDLSLEFLESLTRAHRSCSTLLYAFIIKTLRVQGIMPEMKCCVDCGKDAQTFGYEIAGKNDRVMSGHLFSVNSGGIVCEDCAKREKLNGNSLLYKPKFDIITVVQFFVDTPLSDFEKIMLKDSDSEQIRQIISEYINHYLDVDVLNDDMQWR